MYKYSHIYDLDKHITENEVEYVISNMSRCKSSGLDDLINEMFIDSRDILSPYLARIFNHLFDNSLYPAERLKGKIVPILKKGDLSNVSKYRGITIISVFSKIFPTILNNRLVQWSESTGRLDECQFGFREGRNTIDCIYILQSLIERSLSKKLYCAFVDYKMAFDLVNREELWFKLTNNAVSTKMLNILKAMYTNTKLCASRFSSLSEFFESNIGVKQSEPLSPLLFLFFINDVHEFLDANRNDSIDFFTIFLLLFADDMVLIS